MNQSNVISEHLISVVWKNESIVVNVYDNRKLNKIIKTFENSN